MFSKKKSIWLGFLLAVVSFSFACDDQTNDANKLVDEGNAIIAKNNELVTKAAASMTELLGDNFVKAEDAVEYIAENKAKLDELVKMSETTEKGWNDAAAKFEQASNMKVDEKYKEYLKVSAQEFKKRGELEKVDIDLLKAIVGETKVENIDKLVSESNKKSADLKKEADDLKAKADKIRSENPDIFKKD